MPNTISTEVNETWVIDAGHEQWVLEASGSISSDGLAIYEKGHKRSNTIHIEGDIHSQTTVDGSEAVFSNGINTTFIVHDTSTITTETGFDLDGTHQTLRNNGVIDVTGTAVLADENSFALKIFNSGEIDGDDTIVLTNRATLTNSKHGVITATETAISPVGELDLIVNKGFISAPVAIQGADRVVFFSNYGTVKGSILLGSGGGQLEFFDGSVVKGEVNLGNGALTIHGGASFNKPIVGGAADNTYNLIGKVTADIQEGKDGGTDTVYTTMRSYTLGDNFERLYMGGHGYADNPKPQHGIGNALDNVIGSDVGNDILDGRAGDDVLWNVGGGVDTLTGGAGADTFVITSFKSQFRHTSWSVIEDFTQGTDTIGVARDQDIKSFTNLLIKQHGDDTWIIGHSNVIAKLVDVDASTLTADDFQFGLDHSTYF